MAKRIKTKVVKYISSSEVFADLVKAEEEFKDSGLFNYGENNISLVSRDNLITELERMDYEESVKEEIDQVIERLKGLPEGVYIDLES